MLKYAEYLNYTACIILEDFAISATRSPTWFTSYFLIAKPFLRHDARHTLANTSSEGLKMKCWYQSFRRKCMLVTVMNLSLGSAAEVKTCWKINCWVYLLHGELVRVWLIRFMLQGSVYTRSLRGYYLPQFHNLTKLLFAKMQFKCCLDIYLGL